MSKDKGGVWRTINGAHVFIKNGQTPEEAFAYHKKIHAMSAKELKEHCIAKSREDQCSSEDTKKERAKIPLNFFGKKSGSKEAHMHGEIPPKPKKAYGFLNKVRLNTSHHTKHAEEMGYKNQDEYEKAAIDFWENGEGTVYYSRPRNRFYKYSVKSQRMLSISCDGIVNTFMNRTSKGFEKVKIQERLVCI